MACLTQIASDIHLDLGEPSNISIPSIAKWLISSINAGRLSNILMSDYSVVDNEIVPALDSGGEDILKLLYRIYYYDILVLSNLSQASLSSIQTIKEGNRTVTKFNKNEIAKTYKDLLKEAKIDLKDAMHGYQMKQIQDEQIAVYNGNFVYECDFCNGYGCNSCRRGC